MTTLIDSICLGFSVYPFFFILFALPIFVATVIRYKAINLMRIALHDIFLLYFICVVTLVLFPLPTMEQAAALNGYRIQWIPFHVVMDIIKESKLQISQPITYVKELFNPALLQMLFNVLLTVPFGMFLAYYYGMDKKKVILASFLLSFIIEITQLTGIYGIYKGSYRICDVDDLMTNTLGGLVGFQIIARFGKMLPVLSRYDIKVERAHAHVRQEVR